MAVIPCLSLAPLRASIWNRMKTTARRISIRMVNVAEIVAGVLLDIFSPKILRAVMYKIFKR
jgi:hypothetical protein